MRYQIPHTNYEVGRHGYAIAGVIVHIQQGYQKGTIDWFMNAISQVSSHCAVAKDGSDDDFVDYGDTAYHAGRVNQPIWSGMKPNAFGGWVNPNYYTYGIECEGFRGDRWTEPQMVKLVARVKAALDFAKLPYTRKYVVSHNEITADKEDMREWCDEVIRRLNTPAVVPVPPQSAKQEMVGMLEKALEIAKKL